MTEPDARIVSALRQQLAARRRLLDAGATRVGWKVALGMEEVGNRPVMGYLTSATLLSRGAAHSAAGAARLCVDAELAVEIGRDGAIAGYAAALELVDLGQGRGSLESVIRANVLHRAFVLGPSHQEPSRNARVHVNDELQAEASAELDLEERAAVVDYWLSALGERLEPGDRIITGSIVQVPLAPGDQVTVEIGELGRLEASILE
jgi:2-keto-4-pentenoate hydratase